MTAKDVREYDERFVSRMRELIAAGEKFEAVKLYAKTTGEGPAAARKQVDEIANGMSSVHDGGAGAERCEVTVVGRNLKEAEEKLEALVATDGVVLKSKIVNKGEKRITKSAATVELAFTKAEKDLPSEETVVRRRVVSEPVQRTVVVKAPDSARARDCAEQSLAKGEKVRQVTELSAGRRRFLGLVEATNEYSVVIQEKKAVVEVICSCQAEILATISQRAQGEGEPPPRASDVAPVSGRERSSTDRLTVEVAAAHGVAAMKVLNDAYLVRHNPELDEAVANALDSIHASPGGLTTLLNRLCDGVVVASGRIRLADWGDMTWNELLKKREIVNSLGRAKDGRAVSKLRELLQAECPYGQWVEIVQPAVARALGDIGTEEAVEALKDALGLSSVPVDSTRAIQEALAEALASAEPGTASAVGSVLDISERTNTEKIGCVGFRLKDPARSSSLGTRLDGIAAAGGGTPARVDAIFGLLESECIIEHPYVYETDFGSAWPKVSGDVMIVVDFEAKWDQFAKKMEAQNYSAEPALLRAMAVNARALELTVQFLSSAGDVVMTL